MRNPKVRWTVNLKRQAAIREQIFQQKERLDFLRFLKRNNFFLSKNEVAELKELERAEED